MDSVTVCVDILAVWRLTHLFQAEDGPWDVLVRFRLALGDSVAGRLLDCFKCLSLWVAAPVAWLTAQGWRERGLLWLALSAGAILLNGLVPAPAKPDYFEEKT